MENGGAKTRIRRATVSVLPPELQVEVLADTQGETGVFDVSVSTGNHIHHFRAGWAGVGWPADVERLLRSAPTVHVAYAQRFSDGAKEILQQHRIGWIDEAGGANIFLRSGLVLSRDARESVVTRRPHGERWTRAMLAATEAILAGTSPRVEAIQESARISRGAAANSLARLEELGLLERRGASRGPTSYREVVDRDRCIDAYVDAAGAFRTKDEVVKIHTVMREPLESLEHHIAPQFRDNKFRWAVSGVAASMLLAPYLSDFSVVECYVDSDLFSDRGRLAATFNGRIVDRGHRIEVRELPTAHSDHGPRVRGIHVALPARVYADLRATKGRTAEAAEHVREVFGV